jgi:hypothetical protein
VPLLNVAKIVDILGVPSELVCFDGGKQILVVLPIFDRMAIEVLSLPESL